jgi:signal transduction histidine kinase
MLRLNAVDAKQYSLVGKAVTWLRKVLIAIGRSTMKTSAGQSGHVYCAVVLLFASGPALASPVYPAGVAGAALLWVALCAGAWRLLRANLRYHEQLARMEAKLAEERLARAQAEQALHESHGIVCKLVLEQAGVRDAERSRIARDIHDDLGQNLLALRIDLSLMQVATNGIHPAMRSVINNLRPLALGEGLRTAVERQLVEFTRLSGVDHALHVANDAALDCDAVRGLDAIVYRVLQEALSNVARHARASRVGVTLVRDGESLSLCVQDDGVGTAGPAAAGSMGLAGMRERAGAAGGQLRVRSRPGGGTVVELSLPLPSTNPAPTIAS